MALQDYTLRNQIVRGSRWPPAGTFVEVHIQNKAGAWPDGADEWTWQLFLSHSRSGGEPDVTLEADSVIYETTDEEDDTIVAYFHADPDETDSLPAGYKVFYIEVASDDGAGEGAGVCYYDCVAGTARVRSAAGEGA